MISRYDVLIVGSGHAGAQASIALRQRGHVGTIAIVGEEHELPYERPPLSKDYLAGDKSFDRLLIRPAAFWAERRITMLLGRRAIAVDADRHVLTLMDGETLQYGTLIWAAGGAPRPLDCDGHALAGVHSVRTRADVDRLSAELASQPRVVVVGGGYIGLEAAAVLAKRGLSVTLLESQSRVLARVAGEPLSLFYEREHRTAGVDLRTGVTVSCIEGTDRAMGVRLGDGALLPAELVIVGIGIVPAVEPLAKAGAEGDNGVTVDEFCRTSLPDIYAIGDCAAHANVYAGGAIIRLESVQNAVDQATTAARHILDDAEPYRSVPWFWSNQYDLRLQTVGLSTGHDLAIVRGDPARRSFSVAYFKGGRLQALDCVNAARDFVQGKALVAAQCAIAPELVANADVPLKELHGLTTRHPGNGEMPGTLL